MKHYFAGGNPMGQHLSTAEKFDSKKSFEIVGVVKDARYFGVREEIEPMIYVAAWRFGARGRHHALCAHRRPAGTVK